MHYWARDGECKMQVFFFLYVGWCLQDATGNGHVFDWYKSCFIFQGTCNMFKWWFYILHLFASVIGTCISHCLIWWNNNSGKLHMSFVQCQILNMCDILPVGPLKELITSNHARLDKNSFIFLEQYILYIANNLGILFNCTNSLNYEICLHAFLQILRL